MCTTGDLYDEGVAMRHCVGSYCHQALAGQVEVYGLMVNGRPLTLALARRGTCWRVQDLRGFANRRSTAEERLLVYGWLVAQGAAITRPHLGGEGVW